MKLLVTTGSFIAGVVIDDKTHLVIESDPVLSGFRSMSEKEFRGHCEKQKWAVQEVP